jgi:hypothetical protein
MLWPITDQNILHFGVGVGYRAYASHSELDRLFITPGTALTYDLYLGPVWINLHEQLSISDDAVTDPTVSGTGNYSQFQNAIGATATWDMSKVLLRLGYDHANYQTLEGSSAGQHSSSSSELLSCSGGWALGTGSSMGPELSGAFISYSQPSNGTAIQWSAGAYYDAPVSDYVRFRLRAGYTVYETRSGIAAGGTEELSGTYVVLSMAHRLNRMLDYSLSGGRTISFSLFGGPVDAVNVSLGLNWHIMQYTSLGTSFTYDHGKQNLETYDRYGPAISLGRTLTRKLSANLRYQFYERQSNFTTGNYTANIVDLSLSYSF